MSYYGNPARCYHLHNFTRRNRRVLSPRFPRKQSVDAYDEGFFWLKPVASFRVLGVGEPNSGSSVIMSLSREFKLIWMNKAFKSEQTLESASAGRPDTFVGESEMMWGCSSAGCVQKNLPSSAGAIQRGGVASSIGDSGTWVQAIVEAQSLRWVAGCMSAGSRG
jgi:hypothetical protein